MIFLAVVLCSKAKGGLKYTDASSWVPVLWNPLPQSSPKRRSRPVSAISVLPRLLLTLTACCHCLLLPTSCAFAAAAAAAAAAVT